MFWSIEQSKSAGYDVSKLPHSVLAKLDYNNAMRYKPLFENHTIDYVAIEQVMKGYINGQSIVCAVRDYYIKAAIIDSKGDIVICDEGDKCLDAVFTNIKNDILTSSNFDRELISEQKVESFCYGLLQYCISRCKVLESVPEFSLNGKDNFDAAPR